MLDCEQNGLRVAREHIQGCPHCMFYRNGLHAAEVYRAMPQETRGTWSLSQQEVVAGIAGQAGAGEFGRGAAERDDHWNTQGRGQVHGTGIIGDHHSTQGQRGHQFGERRLAGE
jgi:hypothetical protein